MLAMMGTAYGMYARDDECSICEGFLKVMNILYGMDVGGDENIIWDGC